MMATLGGRLSSAACSVLALVMASGYTLRPVPVSAEEQQEELAWHEVFQKADTWPETILVSRSRYRKWHDREPDGKALNAADPALRRIRMSHPACAVCRPIRCNGLSVFPLFAEPSGGVDYALSDEAISEGTVAVEDVSEAGSVPDLSVENKGDLRVLFLEGEELIGAEQNRILLTLARLMREADQREAGKQGMPAYPRDHWLCKDQ